MFEERSSRIKAGLFVVLAAALIIAVIIILGKRAQLFQSRYELTAQFHNVGGLVRGAAVRVAGVNVGSVGDIAIVTKPEGPGAVNVTLEIASSASQFIRTDSLASVRTLGPLGDRYVEISVGSESHPTLTPGQTLMAEETVDFYDIAAQARKTIEHANSVAAEVAETLSRLNKTEVIQDLQQSVTSFKQLLESAKKGPSLVHSMVSDPDMVKMLEDLRASAAVLRKSTDEIDQGKGALGKIINGEKFSKAVDDFADVTASSKNVLREIETGGGTAHMLIYQRSGIEPLTKMGDAAARFDDILKDVQEGKGTLGLLIADPAVWQSIKRLFGGAEESVILKYAIRRGMEKGAVEAEAAER